MKFAPILLLLSTTALASESIHLQSLVPTSGTGVTDLLDGDPATGWQVAGDPGNEGVLLRFEKLMGISTIEIKMCKGASPAELKAYLNGSLAKATQGSDGETIITARRKGSQANVRSVFVRILRAQGQVCLGEIVFKDGAAKLEVKAPRTVGGKVNTSTTLKPIDAYHPLYLFDGRTDFGWVEGAKGLGINETLTIELDKPFPLEKIEIWNGYQRSKDHFKKNARLQQFELLVDDISQGLFRVKDSMGPQTIDLKGGRPGRVFTLKIKKAKKGSRYKDLVISELRLWDHQGPATVTTQDVGERAQVLLKKIAGHPLSQVVGKNWSSYCPDGHSASLKLRSNHTFVWYEQTTDGDGDSEVFVADVFDGAWVVGKKKPKEAVIKLYGRRHRTKENWSPYGSDESESIRIGGGNVRIVRVADLGQEGFAKLTDSWNDPLTGNRVDCLNQQSYAALVKSNAIMLEGKAMLDLMVPAK